MKAVIIENWIKVSFNAVNSFVFGSSLSLSSLAGFSIKHDSLVLCSVPVNMYPGVNTISSWPNMLVMVDSSAPSIIVNISVVPVFLRPVRFHPVVL